MQIFVNGQSLTTQATHLDTLLSEQQIDLSVVACAVDGQFITKTQYSTLRLHSGMRVEVLSPMQGG